MVKCPILGIIFFFQNINFGFFGLLLMTYDREKF